MKDPDSKFPTPDIHHALWSTRAYISSAAAD